MIYIRGVPVDFAAWEQAGAKGWSWEDVLPYFVKAERQQTFDDDLHGSEGPLHVQDVIDKRPIHETFLDAMEEQGVPRNADFNGIDQAGCGYYQFTQKNGRRWSAASAYLNPARGRSNLDIKTNVQTRRIIFEGKKAIGVETERSGRVAVIKARHVIVSCGAIGSPQLLELSGVGDSEQIGRAHV